jgi:hypothetical protein
MQGELAAERTSAGSCCDWFRIGGITVEMAGTRPSDIDFPHPLSLFRSEATETDIEIQVQYVKQFTTQQGRKLFDSGSTWRLYEDEAGFQFDFLAVSPGEQPYRRLIVDRFFENAVLQMNEFSMARAPFSVSTLAYPLDELLIMHRLTQEQAIELHGAGIVTRDGIANLFVGHSGAGKSTTTRLWTAREEVEVLSDDRIIVRKERRQARGQFANSGLRMYGTPWHGEAMFASPNSAWLKRILILEHGQENRLTPLTRSHAVAELFARSFVPFHRHEYVESALSFLEEVVESVPVYRFAFEPDQRAVDAVLSLRD